MTKVAPLVLIGALLTTVAGCGSILSGLGISSSEPEPAKQAASEPASTPAPEVARDVTVTVVNTTDRKICRLYVSGYVLSGNGFDYNRLKPNVSDPQRTIAPNGSTKLEISTFASKPSVLAVDCDGKVVMRSYENGSFSGTADATWTLLSKDEGSLENARKARGIATRKRPHSGSSSASTGRDYVYITITNNCDNDVGYCVVDNIGRSPDTSQHGTGRRVELKTGATITARTGSSSCGAVLFTATKGMEDQEFVICQ